MRKLFITLLQVRLAVAAITALGVAFLVVGALIGMPPFGFVVIALLIGLPTVLFAVKRGSSLSNSKLLTIFFVATVVALLVIQLIPYGKGRSNGLATAEPAWATPQTRELMVRACFGCHSNEVEYPAYASVAPISWAVQSHIDEGRKKVNYQEWDKPQRGADETIETIEEGEMPPHYYTMFGRHPEAKLTSEEINVLVAGLLATGGMSEND